MEYIKLIERTDTQARFGFLKTNGGDFNLPACSPIPRTLTEARAVMDNVAKGLILDVVSPPLSRRREIKAGLGGLLGLSDTFYEVNFKRPLVIPDIESEAFNFGCKARSKFFTWNKGKKIFETETALQELANSTLSGDEGVHPTWKRMVKVHGYLPILNWYARALTAISSDVFSVPTPIVRKSLDTVKLAIDSARAMIPNAKLHQKFSMWGVHFLLHGEIFKDDSESEEARNKLIEEVRTWKMSDAMFNLFLSFKVHDPSDVLTDGLSGNSARRNFSDFSLELHEATESSGGTLVAHNFGNWSLGLLDSGADIVSFRMDGKRDIESAFSGGRNKGSNYAREVPRYTVPRALVDYHYKPLKTEFERTGGFPCSKYVVPKPYWNFPRWKDQLQYTSAERFGVFHELGEEYRNAGLDEHISIPDSVRSRVLDSQIIQELKDLCPSF